MLYRPANFPSPKPWLAVLTAPPGPPRTTLAARAGAAVFALPGRYCAAYLLLGPAAVGVIDVGSAADIPAIIKALDYLRRPLAQVRWVMPTHLHFDHLMGVAALARRLKAPVALGRVAADHIRGGQRPRWPTAGHLVHAVPTWVQQGMPLFPLADLLHGLDFGFPWGKNRFGGAPGPVFEHGGELPNFPGWRLLHTPGHADDAICLHHHDAGFLIAGDTVRNFDGGEWNPLLCDAGDYARTKELLLGLNVETVFPGHGPILHGPRILERLRHISFD